jgi:hypothetical protein
MAVAATGAWAAGGGAAASAAGPAGWQPALQGGLELGGGVGLGEVVVHAGGEALVAVALHGVGGQGDHRQVVAALALPGAQQRGGLVAVHHRHLAVHQDGVEGLRGRQREGFLAVLGDGHREAQLLQHRAGELLVDRVVLGQQHMAVEQAAGAGLAVGAAGARPPRCRRQGPADDVAEFGLAYGLAHAAQDAGLLALAGVAGDEGRGEHDQPGRGEGRLGVDGLGELQAVHPGHVHVEDGEIEGLAEPGRFVEGFEGLGAALGAVHLHAPAAQLQAQDVEVGEVVVHHQHPRAFEPGGGGFGRSAGLAARGRRSSMWKREPLPTSLSTPMRPPISSISRRLIASPSPVPPNSRVVEPSAWEKCSKIFSRAAAEMPTPVSSTLRLTCMCSPSGTTWARTTTSPWRVNLMALLSRLASTWRSRKASPRMRRATLGGLSWLASSRPFRRPAGRTWPRCPRRARPGRSRWLRARCGPTRSSRNRGCR